MAGAIHTYNSHNGKIEYTLTRCRRRSIEVRVKDCEVSVRCPYNMPICDIELFLEKKRDWISKHIQQQLSDIPKQRLYVEGERFPFLGEEYPLRFSSNSRFDGSSICIHPAGTSADDVREALKGFYQQYAEGYIPGSVRHYANILNTGISAIRIREYKSQWGSCSIHNRLSFNTKLVLYSHAAIDYVVAHEVAHTLQRNHSKRFWDIVEGVVPNYRQLRAELAHNKTY